MRSLIDVTKLSEEYLELAIRLDELGLLPIIESENYKLMSSSQFYRLKNLVNEVENTLLQTELFPKHFETVLGKHTTLYKTTGESSFVKGLEILIQLLPIHLETITDDSDNKAISTVMYKGSSYEIKTNNANISEFINRHINEFYSVLNQRSFVLARSANYQGSKATFTAAICAIVEAFSTKDVVVLDLMCGAGSVSGALSHYRSVVASDAQSFSRNLAKVQGGGIDVATAKNILSKVVDSYVSHFDLLQEEIQSDLEKENEFLSTEISDSLCHDFSEWVLNYRRVGHENPSRRYSKSKLDLRKKNNFEKPGVLFTSYYANLFFGVRQAAEIDSLRMAISCLDNNIYKQWALGALTATVSYCAYSYAGHFAQPKINLSKTGDNRTQIKEIFKKRSISVHHEFIARLLSLAEESEKKLHDVQDVEGPWEDALLKTDELVGDKDVFVYLDPPYTRDEFSRYYHVLETLTHYNYPEISGKASIPLKGSKGRFRSNFFTRNVSDIENLLVEIILECLNRKWTCLWSYSSGGMANIARVLERLEKYTSSIELFSSKHSYAPQGKQKSKQVIEYFILFIP